eukprot:m.3048 g.3048  ORF g.3048 m.3048 type:complete len:324 (+) comp4405_c0_seq1:63-1034(+)
MASAAKLIKSSFHPSWFQPHRVLSRLQHVKHRVQRGYPYSVNFHFTRKCNYNCHFCFHTEINSKVPPINEALNVLDEFYAHGMNKLNIAGGEPLLYPKYVSEIVQHAKQQLGITVSIVSNASRVKEAWLSEHAELIDYFAISCDSDNDDINAAIGRRERGKEQSQQTERIRRAAGLCHELGIALKVNTVVMSKNHHLDMSAFIKELQPKRWKVFQVLVLDNENSGDETIRDASHLAVSNDDFDAFIARHRGMCEAALIKLVPESNDVMQNSYILLDEELRLLNCSSGSKKPGKPVLDVGIEAAMKAAAFDHSAFVSRDGGYYN